MKYLVAGLVLLVSVAAINIVPNISNELPEFPPFEEMLVQSNSIVKQTAQPPLTALYPPM